MNQLLVTLSSLIRHTGQVGVSFLTVLAHHAAVVKGVLPQKAFGVVVAVDVDLGQGVVGGGLLAALVNASLQPGQQQLQSGGRKPGRFMKRSSWLVRRSGGFFLPISFLHFSYEFIRGELPSDHHDQVFNHVFSTIHIQ